jgi:DNA gyrase/topoisomerase IV subunit A
MIFTKDGLGKRIQMSDLIVNASVDAQGQFILKEYDVAGMFKINPNKPLMMYVTELGRIRVNNAKYLNTQKKFDKPKPIIKLSERDNLLNVLCVTESDKVLLYHADTRTSTVSVDSIPTSTFSQEPVRPKHVFGVKVIRCTII